MKTNIAVFGSDSDHCTERSKELAFRVGKELAKAGTVLYVGGGEGVMEAASEGAKSVGGYVVGIIPGDDKSRANKFCDEVIATEEDFFKRSVTLTQTIDGAIIIEGGIGTLSEMCVAYWDFKPLIALPKSGGIAKDYAGKFLDQRYLTRIRESKSPEDAVLKAVELVQNKKNLTKRLEEAGLSLDIFRNKPSKFIRINPRQSISIRELRERLYLEYDIKTELIENGIEGIYESTNTNIGGWVNGKRNEYFNRNYFIQDLASVVCVKELDLEEGQSLLETCAARGFKSILAHDLMRGKIKITALDIDSEKYKVMLKFFKRFGVNAETQLTDATQYKGKKFDRVLVDAPCSCEGMTISYDTELQRDVSGFDNVVQYSQEDFFKLTDLQGRLLQKGFEHLKDDGALVYATCALNREENENVVRKFLRRNNNAIVVTPDMIKYNIKHESSEFGVRILPERTKGFYFTKIRKTKS
ncbi:MAG: TIGR00725 family protein [Nanoarchaeota archaeon]|nr:TIGR00725 family protein [Nanoarchaeota archaeon]